MAAKMIARFVGVFLLVLGVCGFVPPLVASPRPESSPAATGTAPAYVAYGRLFGMFPTNWLLSTLLLLLGLGGIAMSFSPVNARRCCRGLFAAFMILMFMGMIRVFSISTTFGFMPLDGFDPGLFFMLGMIVLYPAFLVGPIVDKLNEPVFRQPD